MRGPVRTDRLKKIDRPLGSRDTNLQEMVERLRSVIHQTEQASLAINARFMTIAGRARKQLQTAREIVRSCGGREQAGGGPSADLATLLEAVTLETNTLAADINGIIESLQFQDITRQHIEQVIRQLEELVGEAESIAKQGRSVQ